MSFKQSQTIQERLDMTQAALGDLLHKGQRSVRYWEADTIGVASEAVLLRLLDAERITIADIEAAKRGRLRRK